MYSIKGQCMYTAEKHWCGTDKRRNLSLEKIIKLESKELAVCIFYLLQGCFKGYEVKSLKVTFNVTLNSPCVLQGNMRKLLRRGEQSISSHSELFSIPPMNYSWISTVWLVRLILKEEL